MSHITFDFSKASQYFGNYKVSFLEQTVESIHEQMHSGDSEHKNYLGWLDLPENYDREEFKRMFSILLSKVNLAVSKDSTFLELTKLHFLYVFLLFFSCEVFYLLI